MIYLQSSFGEEEGGIIEENNMRILIWRELA
jgi:hypothetical protein